jgi:hypothetical protein
VWVSAGRLPAHKNDANGRRWLVYRRDLDAFLDKTPDIGRPKPRNVVEPASREDWGDAPEQATLDLATSVELPRGRR